MTLEEFYKATEGMPKNATLLNYLDEVVDDIEYDEVFNEIKLW